MKTEEKVAVTPLRDRAIRPIVYWHGFLKRWQAATTVEEMLGLLHAGFEVNDFPERNYEQGSVFMTDPGYARHERISFYLNIADGWCDYCGFANNDDPQFNWQYGRDGNGHQKSCSSSDLRQMVAIKAFDMLCLNYFGQKIEEQRFNRDDDESRQEWARRFFIWELFDNLLAFFRLEKEFSSLEVYNLSRDGKKSHNEQSARGFLVNFIKFIWSWQEEEVGKYWQTEQDNVTARNKSQRELIEKAKPWSIKVMEISKNGFNHLLGNLELKPNELEMIRKVAMQSKLEKYRHDVKKGRLVETLDEAILAGSTAAKFLATYRLKEKARHRLLKIREAEEATEEAKDKLKRLLKGQKGK